MGGIKKTEFAQGEPRFGVLIIELRVSLSWRVRESRRALRQLCFPPENGPRLRAVQRYFQRFPAHQPCPLRRLHQSTRYLLRLFPRGKSLRRQLVRRCHNALRAMCLRPSRRLRNVSLRIPECPYLPALQRCHLPLRQRLSLQGLP